MVVTGDVFEHNQVERQTILRACEALKRIPVPVVLLPGNHDALEPGSLWTSSQWQAHAPEHVTVLTDTQACRDRAGCRDRRRALAFAPADVATRPLPGTPS